MQAADGIHYLFLDLNSYFASVEQQENPRLRGRPVVVTPLDTESTCAIAASYEAKALGIKTGTRIYEARKICPDLQVVPARHDLYVDYHHRIITEIDRHLPIHKVHSIDEASCQLTGRQRNIEVAVGLAQAIKRGIAENVGVCLRSSIGIAPNCFLAKVATELEKPDGLVVLHSQDLPGRLLELELIDIPGIGRNMSRRLSAAGVYTVAQLWELQPKHVRNIWGGVQGERFWYGLRGYDVPEVKTQKRVIGHSRMLDPKFRPLAAARLVARALLLKAAARLRRYEMVAGAFTISARFQAARYQEAGRWKQTAMFPATQDSFVMLENLDGLWRLMRQAEPQTFRLKKISLVLHNLQDKSARQPLLFGPDDLLATGRFRHRDGDHRDGEKLWLTLDQINKRFGQNTVQLCSQTRVDMNYLGTKIAFTRIPERAEFSE